MRQSYLFEHMLRSRYASENIRYKTKPPMQPRDPQLESIENSSINPLTEPAFAQTAATDPVKITVDGTTATAQFGPIQITGTESANGSITLNATTGSVGLGFNINDIDTESVKDGDWYDGNTWTLGYKFIEYPVEVFNVIISLPNGTTTSAYPALLRRLNIATGLRCLV